MAATRDITEHLPRGSKFLYDVSGERYGLVVDGLLIGFYDRLDLTYATHMEYDRFFRDLKVDLKMPRRMEDSRLWC